MHENLEMFLTFVTLKMHRLFLKYIEPQFAVFCQQYSTSVMYMEASVSSHSLIHFSIDRSSLCPAGQKSDYFCVKVVSGQDRTGHLTYIDFSGPGHFDLLHI